MSLGDVPKIPYTIESHFLETGMGFCLVSILDYWLLVGYYAMEPKYLELKYLELKYLELLL